MQTYISPRNFGTLLVFTPKTTSYRDLLILHQYVVFIASKQKPIDKLDF